jgi:PAS domain S-box-containing protein
MIETAQSDKAEDAMSGQKTILIVEDDPLIYRMEARILERYGYAVVAARTGEEAVETALNDADIDLILMDINLGDGIDGTEAASRILARRDMPVIFLSSHSEYDIVEKTDGINSYGYILKNSGESVLVASIRMALRLSGARELERMKVPVLAESERGYRDIINSMNETVWLIGLDGKLIDVNEMAVRKLGYSREELLTHGVRLVDPLVLDEKWQPPYGRECADSLLVFETTHTPRNGKAFPVEIVSNFVTYQGRQAILSIARDITDRKWAENELKRRLEEKDVILKATHHRIKNNIAMIESLLALQADKVKSPEALSALQDALGRVDCMRVLYDSLLLSHDLKEVPARHYIMNIAESLMKLFNAKLRVTMEEDAGDLVIGGEKLFPLGVIVEELITNIMKYAFAENETGLISISLRREGNSAILSVHDNGRGLPEDFDIGRSTGFGLTIVQMLCRQLKAEFRIESSHGTRCVIGFPVM